MSFQNLVGHTFGQYELQSLLGAGGMGAVYRASQRSLKRLVAIKVLSAAVAEQPTYLERFNREAEVSASLEHKHIVPVYDFGVQENTPYIVMRLLTGGSLAQRMQQAALDGRSLPTLYETSNLLKQLASALDYAHMRGIIHRDIKPGNVMFDNLGDAYLVDFGIAKLLDSMTDLTGTSGLGTPSYMPPEQWMSQELTPTADQYALGIAIYNMLTGHLPFDAETPFQMMHKHLNELPTPLHSHRTDLPDAVELVLDRALRKNPRERFPTVTAFAQAFDSAIEGAPAETTGFFDFRLAGAPTNSGSTPPPSRRTAPADAGSTPPPARPTIPSVPDAAQPPPPTSAPPPTMPPPPRRGGFPWLPLVLILVVLIAGIGLIVSQLGQVGNEATPTAVTVVAAQPTGSEATEDSTPTRQALIINTPAPATDTPVLPPTVLSATTIPTTEAASATPSPVPPASATAVSVAALSVPTQTVEPSATPTETTVPSPTPTATLEPSATATDVPSATPTEMVVPTEVPTETPTATDAPSATPTNTDIPTETPTHTPEPTATPTETVEPSPEPTQTPVPAIPTKPMVVNPTLQPTESPLPQEVALLTDSLGSNVEVTFEDDFDGETISQDWDIWNESPILSDGLMVFEGQETWADGLARQGIDRNEGVLILFQHDADLRMEFNLQRGDYGTESYRNWTFARWESWEASAFYGVEGSNQESYGYPHLESDTWYYLLLRIGPDGTFYTQVWERDNLDYYTINVAAQPPGGEWDADDWEFVIHPYDGLLIVDQVLELSFPTDYFTPDFPPNLDAVPSLSEAEAREAATATQAAVERPDVLAFCDDPYAEQAAATGIQAGQSIDVVWYWFASTPENLQTHIDNVFYEVTVDGQLLDDWLLYREPVFRIVDGSYVQYWSVPFGPLDAGEHQIEIHITWSAGITDGFSDYGPGSETPEYWSGCTFTVE